MLSIPNLWTFKESQPYPGPIRDEQGRALSGFKVQDTKHTRKVSILQNGRYQRHYRFPKNIIAPKHPMVSWINTPMCGIPLDDENGNLISFNKGVTEAVLAGTKPVGTIMFWKSEKEESEDFITKAKELGLEIVEQKKPFEDTYMSVMVGVNKPLKELFDLDAIAQFYSDSLKTDYVHERYFIESLEKVSHLTPTQVLLTYDWANPITARDLMLTGLCLGYAFESTLALILE